MDETREAFLPGVPFNGNEEKGQQKLLPSTAKSRENIESGAGAHCTKHPSLPRVCMQINQSATLNFRLLFSLPYVESWQLGLSSMELCRICTALHQLSA